MAIDRGTIAQPQMDAVRRMIGTLDRTQQALTEATGDPSAISDPAAKQRVASMVTAARSLTAAIDAAIANPAQLTPPRMNAVRAATEHSAAGAQARAMLAALAS